MKKIIELAVTGPLSPEMATRAFTEIMSGNASDSQIAGFLIALKMRGETVQEITAAAKVMLEKCKTVPSFLQVTKSDVEQADILPFKNDCEEIP